MMYEMTITEVEDALAKVAEYKAKIKSAEDRRDALIAHYQEKIRTAEALCEQDTASDQVEVAILTARLRRYAENNLAAGKKTIAFPSGKLSFRKQPTRFFFDETKDADAKDERLVAFAKASAPEYVKTAEYVAWDKLKAKLEVVGYYVVYSDTGEVISGLHVQAQPDKFIVTTM